MTRLPKWSGAGVGLFLSVTIALPRGPAGSAPDNGFRRQCVSTLLELCEALVLLQIRDSKCPDFGALQCPGCGVLHTRAAEAVYPFVMAYRQTGKTEYVEAARRLGFWLIRQQQPNGSWKETPEEWTGTTADQLLMMVAAYPHLQGHLTEAERMAWKSSVRKAADYLCRVMSPQFASINYCATTAAALALTWRNFRNETYLEKATSLAHYVVSRMDCDGFISGEGGRVHGVKYGVDLGYDMDMTLWGLGLYAQLSGDAAVDEAVWRSLQSHLYFVLPDGAVDYSWGIRSNKWTTYGSATADGCQILFSLYADRDPRLATAAERNLQYLEQMLRNGMVGYGPHFWELFDSPCIYATFARAKNLALTLEFGKAWLPSGSPLPTDEVGWAKYFPTVDVVLVRTANFLATVTVYHYNYVSGASSKYMHRPTGGSISSLWVPDFGFLQVSSQTEYQRWEPMHFPELGPVQSLTPRIEYRDSLGFFTNLYEFDAALQLAATDTGEWTVWAAGELRDRNQLPGGVAYEWSHRIADKFVEHSVTLRFHDRKPTVQVVEPFVRHADARFEKVADGTVRICSRGRVFTFRLLEGDARLVLGKDADRYYQLYPAVRCFPIVLEIRPPDRGFLSNVRYRVEVQE
ncbi:MAG: hypothetical protein ONB23_11610 [candidate division KSB1 bacterium]|nr:hypothetical protein [candidate division KSB1 bacterium]